MSGDFASCVTDQDRQLFEDFDLFASKVNRVYVAAGSWKGGPWRLQDLPNALIDRYDHPHHGRRYDVFYNQARLGMVEIEAGFRYVATDPKVFSTIRLKHVRLLPFDSVYGFLFTIAGDVSSGSAQEFASAERAIQLALLAAVWQLSREEASDGGSNELTLVGSAADYLRYKRERAAQK